jgi:hypothetical protein
VKVGSVGVDQLILNFNIYDKEEIKFAQAENIGK